MSRRLRSSINDFVGQAFQPDCQAGKPDLQTWKLLIDDRLCPQPPRYATHAANGDPGCPCPVRNAGGVERDERPWTGWQRGDSWKIAVEWKPPEGSPETRWRTARSSSVSRGPPTRTASTAGDWLSSRGRICPPSFGSLLPVSRQTHRVGPSCRPPPGGLRAPQSPCTGRRRRCGRLAPRRSRWSFFRPRPPPRRTTSALPFHVQVRKSRDGDNLLVEWVVKEQGREELLIRQHWVAGETVAVAHAVRQGCKDLHAVVVERPPVAARRQEKPPLDIRLDRRLHVPVSLVAVDPGLPDVLGKLHEATGLTFRVESDRADHLLVRGNVQMKTTQAWTLMRMIAESQTAGRALGADCRRLSPGWPVGHAGPRLVPARRSIYLTATLVGLAGIVAGLAWYRRRKQAGQVQEAGPPLAMVGERDAQLCSLFLIGCLAPGRPLSCQGVCRRRRLRSAGARAAASRRRERPGRRRGRSGPCGTGATRHGDTVPPPRRRPGGPRWWRRAAVRLLRAHVRVEKGTTVGGTLVDGSPLAVEVPVTGTVEPVAPAPGWCNSCR